MHAHTQSPPVFCLFSHLLPTLTHTWLPLFLCRYRSLQHTLTHIHTHLHSVVEKWLYLCCQVCSQQWLWPQTEICSLLHHGGYNDKAAPNIYFLVCPLRCNCYHLCQLLWMETMQCWHAFYCFTALVSHFSLQVFLHSCLLWKNTYSSLCISLDEAL